MRKALATLAVLASMAMAQVFYVNLPVEKSVETISYVEQRIPVEECWDEKVPVQNNDTLGAVIGGAAGGILGNQVGKGSGKTAATIGGAVIGTIIGKNLAGNSGPQYRIIKRCRTVYKNERREVRRYKNYARIGGREIYKISNRPLNYIRVRVEVQ